MTESYVIFSSDINPVTCQALIAVMAQQATNGVATVHLLMSTPGGNVTSGITLYNTLRSFPFELVTHNTGNIDSIGNMVFLAGARRYACAGATFMLHGVSFETQVPTRFDQKILQERLAAIKSDQHKISTVLQARTSMTSRQIKKTFLSEATQSADWAISVGIVHEIRPVSLPQGGTIIPLVFQR